MSNLFLLSYLQLVTNPKSIKPIIIKMIAQYFNLHYSLYISFLTFSYINILGFLLFIVFLLQLSSGILLSIYYNDFFTIAFDSLAFIIINVNNG